jgi:hypothetical protein
MCKHNSTKKERKRISKTTTKPTSQRRTQNENDDNFTQHAGENESLASQDEEGAIEPPRHKQSMPHSFLSKNKENILRNDVKINPLVILAHRSRVIVLSQNVQGLKDEAKLETSIRIIEERKVDAYCVQETWLEGDFEQELKKGVEFIHHGPARQNSGKEE